MDVFIGSQSSPAPPVTDCGIRSPGRSSTPRRRGQPLDQHLPIALKITCGFKDNHPQGNYKGSNVHTLWSVWWWGGDLPSTPHL